MQTRFFLNIFRIFPTGGKFITLAYCDVVLTATIFLFLLSPSVFISLLLVDEKLRKSIPVAVSLLQIEAAPDNRESKNVYIIFLWKFVEGSAYKGYEFPVEKDAKIRTIRQGFSTHGESVEEFSEKFFSNVKNIQVQKLEVVQHWPTGCSPVFEGTHFSETHECFAYDHIFYVQPLFSIFDIRDLFLLVLMSLVMPVVGAFNSLLFFFGQVYFPTTNELYYLIYKEFYGVNEFLTKMVLESNPYSNFSLPITPLFIANITISLIIYILAIGFKLLALLNSGLNWALGRIIFRPFRINEKSPYRHMFLVLQALILLVLFLQWGLEAAL